MINEVLKFIVSLVGLCYGANLLVRGSGQIARAAGVSGLVVGLPVVSLATSAPELFISVIAALNGNADLAIGNVVGSNIANIGLVMALTAVVGRGLVFNKNVANRDCIVMVGATLLVFPLMWDLRLVRWEGGLLAILLFGYLLAVVRSANEDRRARNQPIPVPGKSTSTVAGKWWESLGIVVLGVLLLTGGSMLLRDSVSAIAIKLGVSELIIALTMVSVGTSLPELATSIMAVLKKDKGLALGNIVGSNIFNLTLVLGITSIVAPIRISSEVLYKQYPAMLTITLLLVVLSRRRSQIRLKDGYYLAAAYLGIMGWILF